MRLQWEEAQKESGQPAGKPSLWNTCREFISETPSCNMQCLQVTNILNDSEQLDKLWIITMQAPCLQKKYLLLCLFISLLIDK